MLPSFELAPSCWSSDISILPQLLLLFARLLFEFKFTLLAVRIILLLHSFEIKFEFALVLLLLVWLLARHRAGGPTEVDEIDEADAIEEEEAIEDEENELRVWLVFVLLLLYSFM
jgi:hypothetical protein